MIIILLVMSSLLFLGGIIKMCINVIRGKDDE